MPPVRVREARTPADLEAFVALPYRLHRRNPLWTPQLRRDVFKHLSPARNPFFEHGAAAHFLAERDGAVVGRIAAIENRVHNERNAEGAGERTGFFGFFEAEEDVGVVQALVERAAAWLRERDFARMLGPTSYSTNDECGVLVRGFDTPATLLTPYNPPYYGPLLERAGLCKAKDLLHHQREITELPERLTLRAEAIARRQGVSLRTMDMRRFRAEVHTIQRLYNVAWEDNWGSVPITDGELDAMVAELRPIIVPELAIFAEQAGETVGFAVGLPDFNVALRKNPGGRLFPGVLKVLWAARKLDRVRVLLMGLVPEQRRTGIAALLIQHIWRNARAKGYRWGEAGWVLEDNDGMNNLMRRLDFDPYKTLRLYVRDL